MGLLDFLPKVPGINKAPLPSASLGTKDLSIMANQLALASKGSRIPANNSNNAPIAFGPGAPPQPSPIGADPRQYEYRMGWNLPTKPGEGRPIDYLTLRQVADLEWLLRKAIEVRKNQLTTLTFDIVARDRKSYVRARETVQKNEGVIADVKEFFRRPDQRHPFKTWLRGVLEQHYVYDAVTLYKRRNMDPDGGPVSRFTGKKMGKLIALEQLDGITIKPLLDGSGRAPLPPDPCFQQYYQGIPRFNFTSEELIYAPMNNRVHTPYGFSHVEQFLFLINVQLRYWASISARYTDGTLPEGVAEAPEHWTQQEIARFNSYWDSLLAGDTRALRKLQFVPAGFKFHSLKDLHFDEKLARFLLDLVCIAMDMTPTEMGMEPSHGGLGGKGLGETMVDVNFRRSIRPTTSWLIDEVMNPILWDEFGAPDLEWKVVDHDMEKELDHAQAEDINLRNGRIPLDQLIEEDGGTPIGVGRMFMFGNQVLFEKDLIQGALEGGASLGLITTPEQKMAEAKAGFDQQKQLASMKPPAGGNAVSGNGAGSTARPNSRIKRNKSPEADQDLKRWQNKAIKSLLAGKTAQVGFMSAHIPDDVQNALAFALGFAKDVPAVKAAFADLPGSLDDIVQVAEAHAVTESNSEIRDLLMRAVTRETPPPVFNVHPPNVTIEKGAVGVDIHQAPISVSAPSVNVSPPEVHVAAPSVRVEQPVINVQPPAVTIEQPSITVQSPDVTVHPPAVNIQPPNVQVDIHQPAKGPLNVIYDEKTGRVKGVERKPPGGTE